MWCETNKWFIIPSGTGSRHFPPSGKRLGCGPIRRFSFHICLFCLLALLETVIVVCICMLGHFDPWWWFFSSSNPRTVTRKWAITVFACSKDTFLITKKHWRAFFLFNLFFLSVKHLKLCSLVRLIPTWSSALALHLFFHSFYSFWKPLTSGKVFFCFFFCFCFVLWSVRILSWTLNCVCLFGCQLSNTQWRQKLNRQSIFVGFNKSMN